MKFKGINSVLTRREIQRQREKESRLQLKVKGAKSELMACAWLLDRGYQVCRNVSATGTVDIVAIKDHEVLLLDAKSRPEGVSFYISVLTELQQKRGIFPIFVYPSGQCEILRPKPKKPNTGNGLVIGALSLAG